jgi:homoserine O-acetyltransferase
LPILGDFTRVDGNVIKNCKVGYRTIGTLNAEKSNAVLCTTRFTGTSEGNIVYVIMNTTGLFVIVADALTIGISSSPSNTINFPDITISDMVDSQYQLVTNHLGIDHLHAAGLYYHREYEMDIMYKKERIGEEELTFF